MKGDTILLGRRCNTGYEDGKYSLPAGHVESNETFTECIIREAKEEIGVKLQLGDIKVAHLMHRDSGTTENNERVDVFFVAKAWGGEVSNKEPEKCDDLQWFSINSLPENTISYIKEAINNIKNNIFYSEYGWK
jgi:ADP-ribose pyrophosphatase YjhB (NUDIX family)